MDIEQYIAAMDPELRAGFTFMMPFFSSAPTDPVAARQWMTQMMAATG